MQLFALQDMLCSVTILGHYGASKPLYIVGAGIRLACFFIGGILSYSVYHSGHTHWLSKTHPCILVLCMDITKSIKREGKGVMIPLMQCQNIMGRKRGSPSQH